VKINDNIWPTAIFSGNVFGLRLAVGQKCDEYTAISKLARWAFKEVESGTVSSIIYRDLLSQRIAAYDSIHRDIGCY